MILAKNRVIAHPVYLFTKPPSVKTTAAAAGSWNARIGRVIRNQFQQRCYGSFHGSLEAFWVEEPQHFEASPGTEPSIYVLFPWHLIKGGKAKSSPGIRQKLCFHMSTTFSF